MTPLHDESARLLHAGLAVSAATIAAIVLGNAGAARAESFDGSIAGTAASCGSFSGELSGAAFKAYAGWNILLGKDWVLAPEVSLAASTAAASETRETATFTETTRVSIGRQRGAELRLGRRLSAELLIYAAGGRQRFAVDARTTRRPKPCNACTPTHSEIGFDEDVWTIGAGVELALSRRLTLRGAYALAEGDAYHRHGPTAGLALNSDGQLIAPRHHGEHVP